MKNQDVIQKFLNGHAGKTKHLISTGTELINYYTVIAKWIPSLGLTIADKKYSVTTSVIQNKLRKTAGKFETVEEF